MNRSLCLTSLVVLCAIAMDGRSVAEDADVGSQQTRQLLSEEGNLLILGTRKFRHIDRVSNIAFSSVGTMMTASSGEQGKVVCWNMKTGEAVRTFRAEHVYALIVLPPTGSVAAVYGFSRGLRLWNWETGRELHLANGEEGQFRGAAFSPDGRILIAPDGPQRIVLWDTGNGEELRSVAIPDEIRESSLAVSPDGSEFAVHTGPGEIVFYDVATGERVDSLTLKQFGDDYTTRSWCSLTYSPDGKQLVLGGDDGLARWDNNKSILWFLDRSSKTRMRVSEFKNIGGVTHCNWQKGIHFSPDGRRLVLFADRKLILVNPRTGKTLRRREFLRSMECAQWSPDSKLLAVVPWYWNCPRFLSASGDDVALYPKGHTSGQFMGMQFTPDGRELLTVALDGTLRRWDCESGAEIAQAEFGPSLFPVNGATFSPDGNIFAFGGSQDRYDLHVRTNNKTRLLVQPGESVPTFDMRQGKGLDVYIELLDITGLRRTSRLLFGHQKRLPKIAFAADGSLIAACRNPPRFAFEPGAESFDAELVVFDMKSKKVIQRMGFDGKFLYSLQFSPDKSLLAGIIDGKVFVWNVASGQVVKRSAHFFSFQDATRHVEFSPDGKTLLTTARKLGRLYLQDIDELIEGISPFLHEKSFPGYGLATFSPDGQYLAAVQPNGHIALLNAQTGEVTRKVKNNSVNIERLQFSPDGSQLAAAASDSTILLWKLD